MQRQQHWATTRWQQLTPEAQHESVLRANRGRTARTLGVRIQRAIDAGLLTDDGRRELVAVLLAGLDE
jgi:hypothetical protein